MKLTQIKQIQKSKNQEFYDNLDWFILQDEIESIKKEAETKKIAYQIVCPNCHQPKKAETDVCCHYFGYDANTD